MDSVEYARRPLLDSWQVVWLNWQTMVFASLFSVSTHFTTDV